MTGVHWPWIFLLLPLPLLLIWGQRVSRARRTTQDAIDLPPSVTVALDTVNQNQTTGNRHYQWLLLSICWAAIITAIAQPYKNSAGIAQPVSGRALAVLIDLSTSMERRDFTLDDEQVDRLTVVKHIAGQFIRARQGDRIALVLFGTEAFIASPLTYDLDSVDSILQSSGIGMAGRTTAIGDAMGLAIKSLRGDPATDKAIVLLSDGTNNAGSAEPEDATNLAKTLGITVHTIGLGSDASANAEQQYQSAAADLDEATLQSIAQVSDGRFFRAQTTAELKAIYAEIDSLQSAEAAAPPLVIRRDLRNIFILIALISLCLWWLINQPVPVWNRVNRNSLSSHRVQRQ